MKAMMKRHDAGESFAAIGRRYGISGRWVKQMIVRARTMTELFAALEKRAAAKKAVG